MANITIDQLPETVLPSDQHEFPAMKDGITVKLSIAQVRKLLLSGDLGAIVGDTEGDSFILKDGVLTADADGLAKMADGFLANSAAGRAKMAAKFLQLSHMDDIATARFLGRVSAGSGAPEALTAAQMRTALAQPATLLVNRNSNTASQAFQFSLGGFQLVRGSITGNVNTAASGNFSVQGYTSVDGGANFASGAADYYYLLDMSNVTSTAQTGGVGSAMVFTGANVVDKTTSTAVFRMDFLFDAGSGVRFPRMQGVCSFYDIAGYRMHHFFTQRQAAAKITDVRITASIANAFASNSTLFVEGLA